jgi:3-methyladenine DNA glycosylase AlkD
MQTLYSKITASLFSNENKAKALEDQIYHKYPGYNSLGIAAKDLERLLKQFRPEIKTLSCDDVFALALELYKNKNEDLTSAGNFVLANRPECIDASRLQFFDTALDYFCSWSTIDDFCITILRPVLFAYPVDTLKLLKQWNHSDNMWKRRASVVAFVRKVGESGLFTDQALQLCEELIWDTEDLVRKGVGWCLKDVMRGDKQTVLSYVRQLRQRGVSSTITLYALRDIRGAERAAILER